MKRKRLSDRVRRLETQETVVCIQGSGPPTAKMAAITFYWDYTNKRLYVCIGGTAWKRVPLLDS